MRKLLVIMALVFGFSAHAEQLQLTPENTIVFRGEVSGESVSAAQDELARLDKLRGDKPYKLYLVMDSPGGDIEAGEDFIQFALTVRDVETVTIFAASMASAIVEALPGKRHVTPNGTLMFHRAKVGLSGQIADGEFEQRFNMIRQLVHRLESRNADRMKAPLDWYKKAVKDEMWLLSDSSVTFRAADEVSTIRCSHELIDTKKIVVFTVFIFEIPVEFSSCPLFRNGKVVKPKDEQMYLQYKNSLENKSYWSSK